MSVVDLELTVQALEADSPTSHVTRRDFIKYLGLTAGVVATGMNLPAEAQGGLDPIGFPLRNASMVGSKVYSHSGEYSPRAVDFTLPSRGVSFEFTRKYRSRLADRIGALGRGWTFTYAKKLEQDEQGILYHDGMARVHRFTPVIGTNRFQSPGFYAVLENEGSTIALKQRYGAVYRFERPEDGGRLLTIEDRNSNVLSFQHERDRMVITDPLHREVQLLFEDGLIRELHDHGGRVWSYHYNSQSCLTEIVLPPREDADGEVSIDFTYDADLRLATITDPKGQTFLRNTYDGQGRVVEQAHGNGTYRFEYEPIGQGADGQPIYRTNVRRKNGSSLTLDHDEQGHVVKRTLYVDAGSLLEEDRNGHIDQVPLVTRSTYNDNGELLQRVFPAGDESEWVFDDANQDPLKRGNLLKAIRRPALDTETDQDEVTMRYRYESKFQRRRSITDPKGRTVEFRYDDRGNMVERIYPEVTIRNVEPGQDRPRTTSKRQLTERFEWNAAGQLLRTIDARGAVVEYWYYPEDDPIGSGDRRRAHRNPERRGGYLAKIVQDPPQGRGSRLAGDPADLTVSYRYNVFGKVVQAWDGKGNPTTVEYNAHDLPIKVVSRAPFHYESQTRYDENSNPVESVVSFERNGLAGNGRQVVQRRSTLRQRFEYNQLNNAVHLVTEADGHAIEEGFVRDESENIVRKVQPLGNTTEYVFNARNQVVERRYAPGTEDETRVRYTYTPNGRRSSRTNGLGHTTRYHFDGLHRYRGFTNPGGTTKIQYFDKSDNIVRIEVRGDLGLVDPEGNSLGAKTGPLTEKRYEYDELNRPVRGDRLWVDPLDGSPLGTSHWDGREGVISSVVEYEDNHRPRRIWSETGGVVTTEYDGANRAVKVHDALGGEASVEFDENGNAVRLERLGPEVEGVERHQSVTEQEFDALDRLVRRSCNGEPPERVEYNELGQPLAYRNRAGVETRFLQDAFGRGLGEAATITDDSGDETIEQLRMSLVERDDNSRVVARIDPAGQRTAFEYDQLNRRRAIVYPDGTEKRFELDPNGNLAAIHDPNGHAIRQEFDALNRVVRREIESPDGDIAEEHYRHDGLNRTVAAIANGVSVTRHYDSLARVLEEHQDGLRMGYDYNAAGSMTRVVYPSGQEVRQRHDRAGRITEIRNRNDQRVAQYDYHSNGRVLRQRLGDTLDVNYRYKQCQGQLLEVAYRSVQDDTLVDGHRYHYDLAGNMLQEVQLHRSQRFGDRFGYDTGNRLVKAEYGVQNVDDPDSDSQLTVDYDYSPTGTWERLQAFQNGHLVSGAEGETNPRHAYETLGAYKFDYDANGNRISADNNALDKKRFQYDYANRLVRLERLDSEGNPFRTVEYDYDAFSRQVRRRQFDRASGGRTEIQRVWVGQHAVEEWRGGVVNKSFVYGAQGQPIQMVELDGLFNWFYAHNGRGLATGLFNEQGAAVERYRYDAFGQPFPSGRSQQPTQGSMADPDPLGDADDDVLPTAEPANADTGMYFQGLDPGEIIGIGTTPPPDNDSDDESDEPEDTGPQVPQDLEISSHANVFLAGGALWDPDVGGFFNGGGLGGIYDPRTGQEKNQQPDDEGKCKPSDLRNGHASDDPGMNQILGMIKAWVVTKSVEIAMGGASVASSAVAGGAIVLLTPNQAKSVGCETAGPGACYAQSAGSGDTEGDSGDNGDEGDSASDAPMCGGGEQSQLQSGGASDKPAGGEDPDSGTGGSSPGKPGGEPDGGEPDGGDGDGPDGGGTNGGGGDDGDDGEGKGNDGDEGGESENGSGGKGGCDGGGGASGTGYTPGDQGDTNLSVNGVLQAPFQGGDGHMFQWDDPGSLQSGGGVGGGGCGPGSSMGPQTPMPGNRSRPQCNGAGSGMASLGEGMASGQGDCPGHLGMTGTASSIPSKLGLGVLLGNAPYIQPVPYDTMGVMLGGLQGSLEEKESWLKYPDPRDVGVSNQVWHARRQGSCANDGCTKTPVPYDAGSPDNEFDPQPEQSAGKCGGGSSARSSGGGGPKGYGSGGLGGKKCQAV